MCIRDRLEREFAANLVEPHGRGSRLTEAGRLLAEMAAPLVAGLDSLRVSFDAAQGRVKTRLTVAATPRVLVEDLPEAIIEFESRHPHVGLSLVELGTDKVVGAVESGEAPRELVSPTNERRVIL